MSDPSLGMIAQLICWQKKYIIKTMLAFSLANQQWEYACILCACESLLKHAPKPKVHKVAKWGSSSGRYKRREPLFQLVYAQ